MDDELLKEMYELGRKRHPDAPPQHHAAFANSVTEAVTGWSGGYGGPSMREYWAGRLILRAGTPGEIELEQAISIVEQACYGPVTIEMARLLLEEHCFDDAREDIDAALRLIGDLDEDE